MKTKIYLLILLFFLPLSPNYAQKYLRFQMNDSTFNGFYTETIDSISHKNINGEDLTVVYSFGKTFYIPINNIIDVSIESASLADGDAGEYRIYEYDYEGNDVKKVYVDNRASLFASRNGDFGANDTIFFTSAYNDVRFLLYTDNNGRIRKYNDGKNLLFFDYGENGAVTILDLTTDEIEIFHTDYEDEQTITRANPLSNVLGGISGLIRTCQKVRKGPNSVEAPSRLNDVANNCKKSVYLADNIAKFDELDPETYNERLIMNGLVVVGDFVGIVGAIAVEGLTLGWSSVALAADVAQFFVDYRDLVDLAFPDSKQIEQLQKYYQDKYSIDIRVLPAKDIEYKTATLQGIITSTRELNGRCTFHVVEMPNATIPGTTSYHSNNTYEIKANVNVAPSTLYLYSVSYTCVVDGFLFVYTSGLEKFYTPGPLIHTRYAKNVERDKADLVCSFYDVPEGFVCGVEYSCEDGTFEKRSEKRSDGEYIFSVTGLKENTTYTFRAFCEVDGIKGYGDEKEFLTNVPDLFIEECRVEPNPIFNNGFVHFNLNLSLACKKDQLEQCSEYGYYIRSEKEIKYQKVSQLNMIEQNVFLVEDKDFDKIDYDSYVAEATCYTIGTYIKDADGNIILQDGEKDLTGLIYDRKPSIKFDAISITGNTLYYNETEDKDNFRTSYSSSFSMDGTFWMTGSVTTVSDTSLGRHERVKINEQNQNLADMSIPLVEYSWGAPNETIVAYFEFELKNGQTKRSDNSVFFTYGTYSAGIK